jgi:hypothetical protein
MMIRMVRALGLVCGVLFFGAGLSAQPAATANPAPATKIEAFKPAAGSMLTFGYDELGRVRGVSVDVREMRDTRGGGARGLAVLVTDLQHNRQESSFVDVDEIPELLKVFDALAEVKDNPTQFKNFEVRYATKGELQLTAFNDARTGNVLYAVQAGRTLRAQTIGLSAADMQQLRGLFDIAFQKLSSLENPTK